MRNRQPVIASEDMNHSTHPSNRDHNNHYLFPNNGVKGFSYGYHNNYYDNSRDHTIRDVWAKNLREEFRTINRLAKHYPYVSLDTEFPGVPYRLSGPMGGTYFDTKEYNYQTVRRNVDSLKVIQIGLTLMDASGRTPTGVNTWQFNFRFDMNRDKLAKDSIDLLVNSGLNFNRMATTDGIDASDFAELLTTSGLVLSDNTRWISFDGSYDFGYILKILTNESLPSTLQEFTDLLSIYFPVVYDIKLVLTSIKGYAGSLEDESLQLDVKRYGAPHQAGSDSLLTGNTFFRLLEIYKVNVEDSYRFVGHLYRLSSHCGDNNRISPDSNCSSDSTSITDTNGYY